MEPVRTEKQKESGALEAFGQEVEKEIQRRVAMALDKQETLVVRTRREARDTIVVTIPANIVKVLGIKPGDLLRLEKVSRLEPLSRVG